MGGNGGLNETKPIKFSLEKWLARLVTFFFLVAVGYRVFQNRSVQIGTIVVPKELEDRGYTSRAVGERLRYEIDHIVRKTDTLAKKEQFALADDSGLPDIEVPKTGLSFHTVVLFLQDVFGLQPPQLTGEITEDKSGNIFAATLSISHSRRRDSAPVFERVPPQHDPESLIAEMALRALELIDPYVLALYTYDKNNRKETMRLISECDGKFAKWGWLDWGYVLADEKDFDGAIEKYRKAIAIDPKFALAYYNWGLALDSKPDPDYDKAIEKYQMATDLDPNYAYAYNNWGAALASRSDPDYDGAIANYEVSIYLDRKNVFAYQNWGNALISKAPPDSDGAIQKYQMAIDIDPECADAYIGWGVALTKKPHPDYDAAIEKYKKAAYLDPKSVLAYNNWGNALANKPRPDYDGAIEKYKRAIERDRKFADGKFADAYNGWGVALANKPAHDFDGAIEKYKKASELDPNDANIFNNWGEALADKPAHDFEGAIEKYKRAIEIDPKDAHAYKNLDNSVKGEEHPRDAVAKFVRLAKTAPNDWTSHYVLGLLEIKAGDAKSGVSELRQASKLQPGNQFIHAALQRWPK
jgi:tetratricopeptide (TPR) repeat protein